MKINKTEMTIEGPVECSECKDRIMRRAYIIDDKPYCNSCIKKKFMFRVVNPAKDWTDL